MLNSYIDFLFYFIFFDSISLDSGLGTSYKFCNISRITSSPDITAHP